MKIQFQTAVLDSVIRHYIKGFGKNVDYADYYLDPVKGVVVFKLYLKEKKGKADK